VYLSVICLFFCIVNLVLHSLFFFFFSSRRRHTRCYRDWSSDVCSSDLVFRPEQRVFFYGKVERDLYGTGNLQIIQPQFEILSEGEPGESLEVGRVVAIYESLGGLGPRVLRRLMATALAALNGNIPARLPPTVRG